METRTPLATYLLILLLVFSGGSPAEARDAYNRRTPIVVAVEKVGPAVVNIFTEEAPRTFKNPFRDFFGDNLFDRFFRDRTPSSAPNRRSLGSGVIINSNGYILTNEHVIAKAVRIKVTLIDNREFDAHLIGADIKSDLAVIKIDSKRPLPYVKMGRSDDLMIGESVLAIGNPFGLQHTVTTGIISALDRTIRAGKNQVYNDFIQLDASINPGNSGGPLLNINGSLIGINSAIYQDAEGIGFAIPIDKARRIVEDLIQYGKVRRGWLGVAVQNMSPALVQHFHLDRTRGVIVTKVFRPSPAARAGIQQGDVLLRAGDREIEDKSDYLRTVASYPVGQSFRLEFLQDGKKRKVKIRVSSIPQSVAAEFSREWLGIKVRNITRKLAGRYRLATQTGVVVVYVNPRGASGQVGIAPGDVIRRVNQSPVKNEDEFQKAVLEAGKLSSVVLLVQRGRAGYYVTLEP